MIVLDVIHHVADDASGTREADLHPAVQDTERLTGDDFTGDLTPPGQRGYDAPPVLRRPFGQLSGVFRPAILIHSHQV